MRENLLLILRALLLCASFTGLCMTVRSTLKLNRFLSPFFAASGIIVVLMLAGMAQVLKYAFFALYFAGFAGLVYACVFRRLKPDFALIGLCAAFLLFLVWRMYPAKLFSNDDLSHWGLVARHLLRADAFPDASAATVMFQSYPLGGAAFIYYVARTLSSAEGVWLIAEEFLYGLAFLPLLAHVRRNRALLWPVLGGLFFYLYSFMRQFGSLRVDGLLGFYGLGLLASAFHYRADWKKAALAVSLPVLAVVYLKSSGLFFAALAAASLAWIAARQTGKRRTGLWVFLAALGLAVGAYLLWTLHVRASFPVGMQTKHAVSLANFSEQLREKDGRTVYVIAWRMARKLLHPDVFQTICILFTAACGAFAAALIPLRPQLRRAAKRALGTLLFAIAAYCLWIGMLFLVYVFSMPEGEAEVLASYGRYLGTSGILLSGLAAMSLADLFAEIELRFRQIAVSLTVGTLLAAGLVFMLARAHTNTLSRIFGRNASYIREREILRAAQAELGFPSGGNYLFFWQESETQFYSLFYFAKYEYDTMNATIIYAPGGRPSEYEITVVRPGQEEWSSSGHNAVMQVETEDCTDPLAFIAAHIGEYDAVILGDRDEALDAGLKALLADHDGAPPVYCAYEAN